MQVAAKGSAYSLHLTGTKTKFRKKLIFRVGMLGVNEKFLALPC